MEFAESKFLKSCVIAGLAGATFLLFTDVLTAPLQRWNGIRIAGPVALAKGFDIYYPIESGMKISGLGGPIMALVYTPAVFAKDPTSAVIVGALISSVLFLLPLFLIVGDSISAGVTDRWIILGSLALFLLMVLSLPTLRESKTLVHADAPALGFAAIACWLVTRKPKGYKLAAWVGIGLIATFAFYSKVTLLPVMVSIPLYVAFAHGRKEGGKSLLGLAIAFGLVTAAIALFSDLKVVGENIGTRSFEARWVGVPTEGNLWSRLMTLISVLDELWKICFGPLIVLVLLLIYCRGLPRDCAPSTIRKWFKKNGWTLFALTALMLVPPSVLGRVKLGGGINCLAPAVFFLLMALLVAFLQLSGELRKAHLVLGILIVFLLITRGRDGYSVAGSLGKVKENIHQKAFEFAQKYPGQVYFGISQVSTLLVDGKLYPASPLIEEISTQGVIIPREEFAKNLPPSINWVVVTKRDFAMSFFPEFKREVQIPEFPGYHVFTKEQP